MSTKAALKAAKTALDNEEYDRAIEQAQSVLSSDANNYFAKLFLGRAFEKIGKPDEAAQNYSSAASSKPDDVQGWLGLCSVYEAQGSEKVDEYRDVALKAAELYVVADDRHRCQSTIDKLTSFAKKNGTSKQQKSVLEVLLPGSPVFEFLEGRIPHPSHTYMRLAEMTEAEEAQWIKQQISERRTRLGARLGQVTLEVKREAFQGSSLEKLYQNIIDWSNDDDVRRQFEERLLDRANSVLQVLPSDQKNAKLDQVLSLAEGMVIIHHPFRLAWDLVLESRDMDDLRGLDAGILREYTAFFPESGLGNILKAWLTSELSPFPAPPKAENDEDESEPEQPISPEDRLLLMSEGLSSAEESPMAYRLVGDYYLYLEEHQTAAETARTGLKTLSTTAQKLGLTLQNTRDALNLVLGTSLVHYESPRNHPEARKLFEDILSRKSKSTPALIGLGLIFEETEDYEDAINFLTQALEEDKGNLRVGTELAWCKALNGHYTQAATDLEDLVQQLKADNPRTRDLRAQTLYRIGMCLWNIDTSKGARKDRNGAYSRFLAAIKTNVNFAPAYSSLGIYYGDYAKDKKRARQCFQKAFELSPAEIGAAERLAKSFADQGDWDIVEVIAQRVVDSGRARPPPGSKKKGISWPYSSLGVVQMNRQEYQLAIVSFLAALRISPDDYQSYVGLGESYHNSGRYNSALRTFNHALYPPEGTPMRVNGETWFAKYMLSNVHRELGEYDEAISLLHAVLEERPSEFGVLLSLLQTHVEHAWRCIEKGLFGRSVTSATEAIATAGKISKTNSSAFNMWKGLGDACAIFSYVQSEMEDFPLGEVTNILQTSTNDQMYTLLAEIDGISMGLFESKVDSPDDQSKPLLAALLAYKRGIYSCSHDIHAQAVAWYNLGWAEQRVHTCSDSHIKSAKKHLQAAVRCFKRAIELEAGNAEFWNALGVVTTTLNPKVAQHSFVRSLHLNELNAKVWANLGVLYLLQNDIELAHQAFGRSQSTDPDYAHAWVGEGLIALLQGSTREAFGHFTHAFEIADSSSVIIKRQFSLSTFDTLQSTLSTSSNDLTALIEPLFALEQLRKQSPHDILPYKHLAALLLERVTDHAAATSLLTELCASAEAAYESTESLTALARFALAKSDLARNQLAVRDFTEAVANAQTALDLSSDPETSGLGPDETRKLRLSAHLTAGLAQHSLHDLASSITMFKAALQESDSDPDVVCSLAQVLWAQGGSDERAVARDQLFESIEQHPSHVRSVILLAALSALADDTETLAAVESDLVELRTNDTHSLPDAASITSLLAALASLSSDKSVALSTAQTAVLLHPTLPNTWTSLAAVTSDSSEDADTAAPPDITQIATTALHTAQKSVPPRGTLDAQSLAKSFAGVGTPRNAQIAICLAPWEASGWQSLADAVHAE